MAADRVYGQNGLKKYRIVAIIEGLKCVLHSYHDVSGVSMLLDGGVMQPTNFDVLEDRGLASPTKLTAVAETLNKFRQKHRLTLLPMPQ
eukprot:5459535-Pyramimonas_sp.AAC.1